MVKAHVYLVLTALLMAAFVSLVVIHPLIPSGHESRRAKSRALVSKYGLTDLCLFTEARYTRHVTQTDMFSAFQDHPFSFEHFPSGSILSPPPHLTRTPEGELPHAVDRTEP